MHELFTKPASLTHAENAKDFLVVDKRSPKIQVVMADEIEQVGAEMALASRGADVIRSEQHSTVERPAPVSPDADILVFAATDELSPTRSVLRWLSQILESNRNAKIVALCSPLFETTVRSALQHLNRISLVAIRGCQTLTAAVIRTTRRLLAGECDSRTPYQDADNSARILSAAGLVEILTHRENQILALVSNGYSNRQIAEILGISTRTVSNFIGTTFVKLGLSGDGSINPRVTAGVAYSVNHGMLPETSAVAT